MWFRLLVAFAFALMVATCVAVGEEGSTLPKELKDLLSSSRHSVKLGAALVAVLMAYFISVVKVEEIDVELVILNLVCDKRPV